MKIKMFIGAVMLVITALLSCKKEKTPKEKRLLNIHLVLKPMAESDHTNARPGNLESARRAGAAGRPFGHRVKKTYQTDQNRVQEGKVVQGIGNAYVDEILYAAKVSPFSVAAKIPDEKIDILAKAIPKVLTDAEAHIFKNFPDTITEKERDFLKVHLPKHKLTPKGEVILHAEIASRKTYYTKGQELFE